MATSSLTFKLCFANEIRRFSVDEAPTFASLQATAAELSRLPAFKMTWKDNEGDVITIHSQADLDEALSFLASSGHTAMKIFIETDAPQAAPAYSPTPAPISHFPATTSYPDAISEKARLLEDLASPTYEDNRYNNAVIDPKLRKKFEKMNRKLGQDYHESQVKLNKLRESPFFNEKEHTRQLQVLQDAEIEVCPALSLGLAKRIVKQAEEASKNKRRGWLKTWVLDVAEGRGNWVPDDKKIATLTEKTQRQVKILREGKMPCGWPVIGALELMNLNTAELSSPEIQAQYAQLRDLTHLPEPVVIGMLKFENEERKDTEAKQREKQERKERWCQRKAEWRNEKRAQNCWWARRCHTAECL